MTSSPPPVPTSSPTSSPTSTSPLASPLPFAENAPPPGRPPLPPSAGVLRTRVWAGACCLALIVLGLAWELWLAPLRPGGSWWALKVLPLTLALAGVLKLRMYTYRWLSLLVWLYFTEACVRGWSDPWPANALAMTQGGLCLLLFAACGLHVRLRQKTALREAQAQT